ncbi:MAG: N-acetylmuramoyl-L-alanine amidase [Lachnospiraceae bacterium]|nr:N-acetylmuramoyl-L-alanine amidase [Lachnospiraceae bacterium]
MRKRQTIWFAYATAFLSFLILLNCIPWKAFAAPRIQKTKSPVIIMIDPGHGGDNEGTKEGVILEKEMNMITAQVMKEELANFEGIEVYMTRDGDYDLSLKDRAKAAESVHADFLISIHYNASESHALYGSEAWISLNQEYHNQGYQLGTMFLREYREMGLMLRGIKTRRHSKGNDYYGVLRESVNLGIPAIIVEHCHVDHKNDRSFCDSKEDLEEFGRADARAVAKYFGLKSSKLGIDYSQEAETLPEVIPGTLVPRATQDTTAPELCHVVLNSAKFDEDKVSLTVSARDPESNLAYYSYSFDGGETYTETIPWPEGDILTGVFEGSFTIELDVPDGTIPEICFRAVNPYDLDCASNVITFNQTFAKPVVEDTPEPSFEDATEKVTAPAEKIAEQESHVTAILLTCIVVVATLFVFFLIAYLIHARKHSKSGKSK